MPDALKKTAVVNHHRKREILKKGEKTTARKKLP
jgi:hypothetical protein